MTRNLKSLALLVGALLAIGGLMASAAGAHTPAEFTFEADKNTITGAAVGAPVFRVTGKEVTCTHETFHGTVDFAEGEPTTSTHITIKPSYTGCTAFGFAGAKVTGFGGNEGEEEGNTCSYTLKASGQVDLVCPAGRDVTVEVGTTCISHVPAQTNLGTITFTTENKQQIEVEKVIHTKHDLRLHVNLTGITVTHTDLNFLCPFAGSGEVSTGELSGEGTLWAEHPETGTLQGITWDATVA